MEKICEVCGRRRGTEKVVIRGNVSKTIVICRDCEERQLSTQRSRLVRPIVATSTTMMRAPVKECTCSLCGWTTADFIATQKLGCEHCYQDLSDAIESYTKRCQPSEIHVGKSPSYTHAARGGEYEYLRGQLEKSVKEERFSDAAKFKKLLDGLKEGR